MTSPIALELDGVSVRYRVALDRHATLKETIVRRRRPRLVEHLALDGVTLAAAAGEMLGVIGRNGAGKTTLLNVMARVLHPSAGRLRIRGAVAPLIDLFGGFHPELTGRENAMLRGAFLGLGRAVMRERLDGVAAFAVATSVDADILLIDEALGVGDAEFQIKCAARMDEFRARGVTFVVVSHDVQRLAASCDRIVWLDAGRIRADGCPRDVVAQYVNSVHSA